MKKIYKTPAMLAVTLQQQDMLAESFHNINGDGGGNSTGIGYGGESEEGEGGLVKGGYTSQDLWSAEW